MSAKEKQRFEEMAEKDKGRYDREMASFNKSGGAKGGKLKKFKDPNAPKRALFVFCFFILPADTEKHLQLPFPYLA